MSNSIDFPASVNEFIAVGNLTSLNNINPLFKLAAVNMLMTRALQGALNAHSDTVRLIATEIEAVSKLNVRVQTYRQNGTDLKAPIKFGTNKEDAKQMLDQMVLYGVDSKDLASMYAEYNDSQKADVTINDSTVQKIVAQLSAYIDTLNTRYSQEQLTLQTLTNRYTQAGEQASNVLQKDAQSKSTIINNSRGLA